MGKRKSFVGTPCWMAPEVIIGQQYDASADIWSFGITALELAQGRAPLSRAVPAKVLTEIVTAPPPALDRHAGVHTYSAAFADTVAQCLQKDPSRRPSAQALLNSSFFRSAKRKQFLVSTVLHGLPPLVHRQEKRRLPSTATHATMDSWDFGSPLASPSASVHSAHYLHRSGLHGSFPKDGIVERGNESPRESMEMLPPCDEDAVTYARRIRERHRAGSRSHSRTVSWTDSDDAPVSHCSTQVPSITEIVHNHEAMDVTPGRFQPEDNNNEDSRNIEDTVSGAHAPLASPTPSNSHSSYDSSFASTDPTEPMTPPQSVMSPTPKLWRRLVKRSGSGSKGKPMVGDSTRTAEDRTDHESFRRKAFGGVGTLAGKAGLLRTASNGHGAR
jgi:serine/threonine-protein kinase OSR1/STK39